MTIRRTESMGKDPLTPSKFSNRNMPVQRQGMEFKANPYINGPDIQDP